MKNVEFQTSQKALERQLKIIKAKLEDTSSAIRALMAKTVRNNNLISRIFIDFNFQAMKWVSEYYRIFQTSFIREILTIVRFELKILILIRKISVLRQARKG